MVLYAEDGEIKNEWIEALEQLLAMKEGGEVVRGEPVERQGEVTFQPKGTSNDGKEELGRQSKKEMWLNQQNGTDLDRLEDESPLRQAWIYRSQ